MDNNQINYQQQKKKQTSLMIIGLAVLVIGLVGITYAFFNYTRTGSSNNFRVGKMAFNSNQTETIGLTNVFPISSTQALTDTANIDEAIITIIGDTTYDYGIEYLVTAVDVSNTVNGKVVPIGIIVSGNNLGNADDNYFDNRGGNTSIYNVISTGAISNNEPLLVGYIAKGATGVNGSVSIKAYIDDSMVAISDTYDETESEENGTTTSWVNERVVLTTSEWNSLQSNGISFKVKVEANEGTWVTLSRRLYSAIVQDNNSNNSSDPLSSIPLDNENSTYVQNVGSNTIENARVQFLDINNNESRVLKLSSGIDFSNASSGTNGNGLYIRKGTENDEYPIVYYRGNVSNNNVIFAGYCWLIVRTTETGGVKIVYNGVPNNGTCMPNEGESSTEVSSEVSGETSFSKRTSFSTVIDVNNENQFKYSENPINYYSLAYIGYMYGDAYESKYSDWDEGVYFGSGFTYNNGEYTLTGTTVLKPDATHHYSCNLRYEDRSCSELRYVYFAYKDALRINLETYYIKLTGGDDVDDALEKMLSGVTTNSYIKTIIDTWYENNMTNYTSYLEDTIWCNDRSIAKLSGWGPSNELASNSPADMRMVYSAYDRVNNTHIPSLSCSREVDRFTVSSNNGNGALTYPVGLLTADELMLAGETVNKNNNNKNSYLWNDRGSWTMSPGFFTVGSSDGLYVDNYGTIKTDQVDVLVTIHGLRPSVSLKAGTKILNNDADGTAEKPYIVGENTNRETVVVPQQLTMDEMCPNCVYVYSMDNYGYTSWNKSNKTPSKISDFSVVYNDWQSAANASPYEYFIGMVVNDNTDEIDRVFVCGMSLSNKPFCIEQTSGTGNTILNQSILETRCDKSGESGYNCAHDTMFALSYLGLDIDHYGDACYASSDGVFNCYEY